MFIQALKEAAFVFAGLVLLFGYIEYRYKGDVIYVVTRLVTARKYWIPFVSLPPAYVVFRLLMHFLFTA